MGGTSLTQASSLLTPVDGAPTQEVLRRLDIHPLQVMVTLQSSLALRARRADVEHLLI